MGTKNFERSMEHPHTLYIFSKKTGKIRECLETSVGKAQLVFYALINTKKSENAYVVETDTELVTDIIEGTQDFPIVKKDIYEEELYASFEEVKK